MGRAILSPFFQIAKGSTDFDAYLAGTCDFHLSNIKLQGFTPLWGYSLTFNTVGSMPLLADPQALSLSFWRPAPNSMILRFFRFVDPKY